MSALDERTEKRRAFIINTVYIAIVCTLVILAFKYLVPWLLPFIIGYAIAILFKPIVNFLVKRTKMNAKVAGCIVLLLAYALIGTLLFFGGAKLIEMIKSLFSGLPDFYTNTLQPAIVAVSDFFNNTFGSFFPDMATNSTEALQLTLQDLQSALLSVSTTAISSIGSFSTRIPGFLLAFFFAIMSSLIISMNYREVTDFITNQVPQKYHEIIMKIKNDTLSTVGKYITAYIKIMGVTFLELVVGLTVLRVPNSVLIALGIAIFDALPILGTGGIMIPWILIELINMQFPLALGLLILYAIITLVRNIIEPRIVGNQLGLHPLVTLCAIYVGFKLMGVLGMIIFPILVQVMVGLHRSGVIKLWR